MQFKPEDYLDCKYEECGIAKLNQKGLTVKIIYTYFIAYQTTNTVGNAVITRDSKIENFASIQEVESLLADKGKVVLTNLVLLKEETET